MPHAIAIASIMHESNSFNPEETTLADFEFRRGATKEDTLAVWSTGDTEVAGMLQEVERLGSRAVPVLYATATPKGPVSADAFEHLCAALLYGLQQAGHFDGVLLALHGAMYTVAFPHADEEIVRRVRAAVPASVPIVVTHDFHANVPPGIADVCDALVIYQQNPHIDTRDRGRRAASILVRMLNGEVRPRQSVVKPGLVWNIAFQSTAQEPLKGITDASIDLEKKPKILAASVAGGYQYNDAPHMGPTIVVVSDGDAETANQESRALADMMWERRDLPGSTCQMPNGPFVRR